MIRSRVLFVDDEPNHLKTLAAVLTQNGFDTTAVATVPEALQLIHEQVFELLLTDLRMPGEGFTVVREMHRLQPAAGLLVLTGYVEAWQQAPPDVRGFVDAFIEKPADIPALLDSMRDRCTAKH